MAQSLTLGAHGGRSSAGTGGAFARWGWARMPALGLCCAIAGWLGGFVLPAEAVAQTVTLPSLAELAEPDRGSAAGLAPVLLALPAPPLRPTYIAFLNTLTVPLLFAPAAAGWLAQHIGYAGTYAVSLAATLTAVVLAGSLRPRTEADAPDIDGRVYVRGNLAPGEFANVKIISHTDYDLIAEPARRKSSGSPVSPGKH